MDDLKYSRTHDPGKRSMKEMKKMKMIRVFVNYDGSARELIFGSGSYFVSIIIIYIAKE